MNGHLKINGLALAGRHEIAELQFETLLWVLFVFGRTRQAVGTIDLVYTNVPCLLHHSEL